MISRFRPSQYIEYVQTFMESINKTTGSGCDNQQWVL